MQGGMLAGSLALNVWHLLLAGSCSNCSLRSAVKPRLSACLFEAGLWLPSIHQPCLTLFALCSLLRAVLSLLCSPYIYKQQSCGTAMLVLLRGVRRAARLTQLTQPAPRTGETHR